MKPQHFLCNNKDILWSENVEVSVFFLTQINSILFWLLLLLFGRSIYTYVQKDAQKSAESHLRMTADWNLAQLFN